MLEDAFGGVPKRSSRGRFSCTAEQTAEALALRLSGEFDLDAVDLFVRLLAEAMANRPERVVLDLRALTFIDSSGLTAVMKLEAGMRGATLTVVPGPAAVQRIFEYTGLARRLTFVEPA